MNYVYHGSKKSHLKIIERRISSHNKNWVYASFSEVVATVFINNGGCDLHYHLSGEGTEESPIILVERKKDIFDKIYNTSGSLYVLNEINFTKNKTSWSAEVVSEYDEPVVNEIYIKNILEKIEELSKAKKLVLYRYPNRPPFIPLDNRDLIAKVVKWNEKGQTIFLELYPELKTQFDKVLKSLNTKCKSYKTSK